MTISRLTEVQINLLHRIYLAGDVGYEQAKPIEFRTLDVLFERMLIRRTAKNDETGKVTCFISGAGKLWLENNRSTLISTTHEIEANTFDDEPDSLNDE